MVKLFTYRSLRETLHEPIPPIDTLYPLINMEQLVSICPVELHDILLSLRYTSEFSECISNGQSTLQELTLDSTTIPPGYKVAIYALWSSLDRKDAYVPLFECGPHALRKTLEVLNRHDNLYGVLSQPLELAGPPTSFRLMLNNKPEISWFHLNLKLLYQ